MWFVWVCKGGKGVSDRGGSTVTPNRGGWHSSDRQCGIHRADGGPGWQHESDTERGTDDAAAGAGKWTRLEGDEGRAGQLARSKRCCAQCEIKEGVVEICAECLWLVFEQ